MASLCVVLSMGGFLQILIFRVYESPVTYVEPIMLMFIGIQAIITLRIRKKRFYQIFFFLCGLGIVCSFIIMIYFAVVEDVGVIDVFQGTR